MVLLLNSQCRGGGLVPAWRVSEIIELEEAQRLINAYALIHQVYTAYLMLTARSYLHHPNQSRLCTRAGDRYSGLCSACLSIIGEQAFFWVMVIHSCPSV